MRSAVALVVVVAGCGFRVDGAVPGDGVPVASDALEHDAPESGPWLAGYGYRRAVTVTPPGTGALEDFPVAVRIAGDASLAAHASGMDFVVTAADMTTPLDAEVSAWAANGDLVLWVRVPTLPLGAPTTLWLYYGGPPAQTNPTSVWPTAIFRGVWHLDQMGAMANDSTTRANHLTTAGGMTPGMSAGAAGRGGARMFDGVDDRLEVNDPPNGSLDVGTSSFTLSAFVRATGSIGQYDNPVYKGGTTNSLPGYCLMLGSGDWSGKVHDGSMFDDAPLAAAPILNTWVHLAMVVDRAADTIVTYRDGVVVASTVLRVGSLDGNAPLWIGSGSGGSRFRGEIDEVWIAAHAQSAAWIAAEHANLASPTFVTVGGEDQRPSQ